MCAGFYGKKLVKQHFVEVKGKVVIFEDGSYLIEKNRYIEYQDGAMKYISIESYKKYKIKFNINGTDGYSVWDPDREVCLECFWVIKEAKEYIDFTCLL